MCVANSLPYARDLIELHLARHEAAEEIRLNQVFMEWQCTAIQEEQEHLTHHLPKSAQLEVELAKRDKRLTAQDRHLEEALEALRVEKWAFQAEREAYRNAAQVGEALAW